MSRSGTDENGRPIVAELGRAETPQETADRKAISSAKRRSNQTVINLVIAVVASLGIVVFLLVVVVRPDAEARAALEPFAEGVYLHQVVARSGVHLRRYLDLPQALADAARPGAEVGDEWRVHFHVPVFRETLGPFENTQAFLVPLLARLGRADVCAHLEVETYTWDVLPAEHRAEPVDDAIARELRWTLEKLGV